jgi:hypothetical protein
MLLFWIRSVCCLASCRANYFTADILYLWVHYREREEEIKRKIWCVCMHAIFMCTQSKIKNVIGLKTTFKVQKNLTAQILIVRVHVCLGLCMCVYVWWVHGAIVS